MSDERYICEIDFSVMGLLRFISHLELQNFFCKLVIRCNIPVKFSSGFNPHPKVSLSVPRSVGIESHHDRARMELYQSVDVSEIQSRISGYVPNDMPVHKVWLTRKQLLKRPVAVEWKICLENDKVDKCAIERNIDRILEYGNMFVERISAKKGKKIIDAKQMIEHIRIGINDINIKVKLLPNGTLKPIEILQVLGLEDKITLNEIIRTDIYWI